MNKQSSPPSKIRKQSVATLQLIGEFFDPKYYTNDSSPQQHRNQEIEQSIIQTIQSLSTGLEWLKSSYYPLEYKILSGTSAIFKKPLKLKYYFDFQIGAFCIIDKDLGIHSYGSSVEHLWFEAQEDLVSVWNTIVTEDDDTKLSPGALKTKNHFLKLTM